MNADYPNAAYMADDVPASLLPAVELLSERGYTMVEYGQRALPKYGPAIVVDTWEYAIPDDDLQSASNVLAKHGFPYISPDPDRIALHGDFDEKGRSHHDGTANEGSLRLLPLSITCISLADLSHIPLTERPAPTIFRLPLPQHCLSLVRCIASYPPDSHSRMKPALELSTLNAFAIFEYKYYSKEWDRPEESEEEYQEKVRIALEKVRSWDLPERVDRWRRMLETVVTGGRSEDIPYEPDH